MKNKTILHVKTKKNLNFLYIFVTNEEKKIYAKTYF